MQAHVDHAQRKAMLSQAQVISLATMRPVAVWTRPLILVQERSDFELSCATLCEPDAVCCALFKDECATVQHPTLKIGQRTAA